MRSRSWMAALAALLVASLAPTAVVLAGDEDDDAITVENTVRLELRITGLTAKGCEIEIKPAHPGCEFKAVKKKLTATNYRDPITIQAKATGAEHDCSFAITIREPGQKPKTYRRGLCLSEPTEKEDVPKKSLRVYLSAPSVAARDTGKKPK